MMQLNCPISIHLVSQHEVWESMYCDRLCVRQLPVLLLFDAIKADGAVGAKQNDRVSEHVEQQCFGMQLSNARKGIVQVRGAEIQSHLHTRREKMIRWISETIKSTNSISVSHEDLFWVLNNAWDTTALPNSTGWVAKRTWLIFYNTGGPAAGQIWLPWNTRIVRSQSWVKRGAVPPPAGRWSCNRQRRQNRSTRWDLPSRSYSVPVKHPGIWRDMEQNCSDFRNSWFHMLQINTMQFNQNSEN